MNKYVLIPHDQYLRIKSFVVENKDKTENVIENPAERKENSIKKDKTEEKESDQRASKTWVRLFISIKIYILKQVKK